MRSDLKLKVELIHTWGLIDWAFYESGIGEKRTQSLSKDVCIATVPYESVNDFYIVNDHWKKVYS